MGRLNETMGFNSSAVIAGVLGSLLVVGIVLVVTNSNDVNAPAEAQQTELMTELMAESPPDFSRCKFVNDREAWDCPNPNPKHCKDGISRITRKCCDPNFDPPPPSTDWCMTPNGTTASAVYQREHKALQDFYAATGGPHNADTKCNGCSWMPYTKGSRWLGTNNHCEWYGVDCVGMNYFGLDPFAVQMLMLGQTNLSGTLPESIGDFHYTLNELDLSGGWPEHPENKISGTVPESIGKLTGVNALRLESQALSGTIPASIGDMAFSYDGANPDSGTGAHSDPPILTLNNNQFTGPLPASLCADNVNYFDVSDNHLTGTVPASCFTGTEAFLMMLENNFTGQVPACRGPSCPGPCGLYAPVSCQDCQQPPLGCCDAGKTCVYNCTINDSCPPPPPPPPTGNYKCNGLLKICLPFGGTQSHSDCKAAC